MALDSAQAQKAQAKAQGLLRRRQPKQHISDLLVLIVQLGALPIARLTDVERPACQPDADALHRRCFFGQLPALSWPCHFFPSASFKRSFCMLASA
jgi:hypothetical protein